MNNFYKLKFECFQKKKIEIPLTFNYNFNTIGPIDPINLNCSVENLAFDQWK